MVDRIDTESKLKLEQQTAKKNNGSKEIDPTQLTEAEQIQLSVFLEKLSALQAQVNQVRIGLSGLITTIVSSRGLDPQHYGVNLQAGRVLPLDDSKQE